MDMGNAKRTVREQWGWDQKGDGCEVNVPSKSVNNNVT